MTCGNATAVKMLAIATTASISMSDVPLSERHTRAFSVAT
jgi:hypothetical protein